MRRKVRPISATTGREEHQNTMDKRTNGIKAEHPTWKREMNKDKKKRRVFCDFVIFVLSSKSKKSKSHFNTKQTKNL